MSIKNSVILNRISNTRYDRKAICKVFPKLEIEYYKMFVESMYNEFEEAHSYLLSLGETFNNFANSLDRNIKYNKRLLEDALIDISLEKLIIQADSLIAIVKHIIMFFRIAIEKGHNEAKDKILKIKRLYNNHI